MLVRIPAAPLSAEQVDCARAVAIETVIDQRGIKLRGRIERTGPCPVCGGHDRFAVNIHKGIFNCRGCNARGDVIALVQHLDGVGFVDAVRVLAGAEITLAPRPATASRTERNFEAEAHARRQHAKARNLFEASRPAGGTIAETYLATRGIEGPLPGTVRFLPQVGDRPPAMLVPFGLPAETEPGFVEMMTTAVVAVQVVLLRPDGRGKADVKPTKLTIGSPAGMPLVLAPMNDLMGLAITEGVEDALSIHQSTGLGAWAAGGWSFMPKLIAATKQLTATVAHPECITIFADADPGGQRGARELAEALAELDLGIEILVDGIQP